MGALLAQRIIQKHAVISIYTLDGHRLVAVETEPRGQFKLKFYINCFGQKVVLHIESTESLLFPYSRIFSNLLITIYTKVLL